MYNSSKIAEKLKALNGELTKDTDSWRWKPKAGKSVVRVLPNPHFGDGTETPFLPVDIYYGFGAEPLLGLSQFDESDPIAEYRKQLLTMARMETGDESKRIWMLSNKFAPAEMVIVPVLVRGEEDRGVRFWLLGKNSFKDLMKISEDSDYESIFNLKNGHDITVEYVEKNKTSTGYASITILPKPKSSPATTDAKVLQQIKEMADPIKFFKKPSYDELKTGLDLFLNSSATKQNTGSSSDEVNEKETFLKELSEIPVKGKASDVANSFAGDFDDFFKQNQ